MADSKALQQAVTRLDKARRAVSGIVNAQSFAECEAAWSDFLTAAATIYSKLEQGSKVNGKAQAWFNRVKKERKDDPLLRYIHHARNSDEHSIAEITQRTGPGLGISEMNGGTFIATLGGGKVDIQYSGGEGPARFTIFPPDIRLIPVHDDRYNDTFDPPTTHLGRPVFNSPKHVAVYALEYLEQMVKIARELGV